LESRATVATYEGVIGTQLGAYRVLDRLGQGGMGSVWTGEHVVLGRRVALKVLHPAYSARPDIVTRFFNEARAAVKIADPGTVEIFDFGQHTDGTAYLVMELLDGEPLDRRLARQGVLDPRSALRIVGQVATTLAAAHACGIVHRDVKPENIFLIRDPAVEGGERAKILDFGIAKIGGGTAMPTQTSAVFGTPLYMSPEQCRGAGYVDARSDLYALGCVLFELVTGRPPFRGQGMADLVMAHLRETPPTPSTIAPGIAPEVDHLVLRCLAKRPDARPGSARALATAIDDLLGHGEETAAQHASLRVTVRGLPATTPALIQTLVQTRSSAVGPAIGAVASSRRTIAWAAIAALLAGALALVTTERIADWASRTPAAPIASGAR
jgi:serine/threonine-protein kinase